MAATGEAWRLGRRPALDGLRGIAIVLVVISHAIGPAGSRLGQVGVSMFFTLSGFLIAARLSEEHAATGRIIFRAFYLGRARRLLPALLACVAVCGLTAWLVGSWFARPREVVAALLYATNWLSLASGAPHGALSHTWSLAIEEQFYVVWPAVFAVLAARRRGAVWLTALVSAGILGSLAVRLAHGPGELDRDLFGSDARAGEVLIGVLLALVLSRVARVTGWWSQVTPAGVGACVAVACAPGPWVATWGLLLVPIRHGSGDPGLCRLR